MMTDGERRLARGARPGVQVVVAGLGHARPPRSPGCHRRAGAPGAMAAPKTSTTLET